jgi:hypothetical protein
MPVDEFTEGIFITGYMGREQLGVGARLVTCLETHCFGLHVA